MVRIAVAHSSNGQWSTFVLTAFCCRLWSVFTNQTYDNMESVLENSCNYCLRRKREVNDIVCFVLSTKLLNRGNEEVCIPAR